MSTCACIVRAINKSAGSEVTVAAVSVADAVRALFSPLRKRAAASFVCLFLCRKWRCGCACVWRNFVTFPLVADAHVAATLFACGDCVALSPPHAAGGGRANAATARRYRSVATGDGDAEHADDVAGVDYAMLGFKSEAEYLKSKQLQARSDLANAKRLGVRRPHMASCGVTALTRVMVSFAVVFCAHHNPV